MYFYTMSEISLYLQMWNNRGIFLALWLPDLFHCICSLHHFCVVPWVVPDLWVSSEYFILRHVMWLWGKGSFVLHLNSLVCLCPLYSITILVTWNDCRYDLGWGTKTRLKILMELWDKMNISKLGKGEAFLFFVAVAGKVCKPMDFSIEYKCP